jgi:carbonic anhydrase
MSQEPKEQDTEDFEDGPVAEYETTCCPGHLFLPDRLVEGYDSFLNGRFAHEHGRFRKLAETGQKPKVLLIGCSDSRVSPEVIFDAEPGEIFVVRNVANLIPPYRPDTDLHGTSAALEFGVVALGVEHIVVMGHALCGGVRAFAQHESDPHYVPLSPGDFIGHWISLIEPAAKKLGLRREAEPLADYSERLAKASVVQQLANLRSFPYITEREADGRLKLHGAYFGIADGLLLALNEETGQFLPVAEETHPALSVKAKA